MKVRFLLIAAFIGCTFGPSVDTCPGVCWSYTQTIEDGGMDGFFDHQCRNSSGQLINVNIPTSGDMTGQTCVTNPVRTFTVTALEAAELALVVEGIDLADARRRPRWQPRGPSHALVTPVVTPKLADTTEHRGTPYPAPDRTSRRIPRTCVPSTRDR